MILGQYTVAELQDLVKAKDVDIAHVQSLWDQLNPQWNKIDGSSALSWSNQWNAFLDRYHQAHGLADMAILKAKYTPFVSDDIIPSPVEYQAILSALTKKAGIQSEGDFSDLAARIDDAKIKITGTAMPQWVVPQPEADDIDLDIYKEADKLIQKGPLPKNPNNLLFGIGIGAGTLLLLKLLL